MTTTETVNRAAMMARTPTDVRAMIRRGEWHDHTAALADGYVQANLVVLPREYAYEFLLFCVRNPKPCPLLEVTEPGSPFTLRTARDADLRTDIPRYRVYEHGQLVEEPTSIAHRWRDDFVAFLLGCSFTFEHALAQAGVPLRHWEQGKNVPMFRTNRQCEPAGIFHGQMVVSMRPIPADRVARAVEITARYPAVHGAPVYIGDPTGLGIADTSQPDWGDAVAAEEADIPVFWACGVTPQAVAIASKPSLMITHAPGAMFVTDITNAALAAP